MKNILRAFMILAAAIAAMSCEKAEPEGEKLNQNLSFTLKADNIEHNSARIVVSHNGSSTDTWYGFYVEGEVKSLGTVILKEIETLKEGDLAGALETGTRKNINLRKLNPSTTYTYIAVGLTAKGEVYGIYNSVKFTTAREIPDLTETDTWSIEYERGTFTDPSDGEEYPNTELFTVTCEEGKYFYFDVVDQWLLEYYELSVPEYIEVVIETVEDYKKQGATAADLFYMDTENLVPANRKMWGNYYAIAIGYDAECNLTGEYSLLDFEIEEEEATPEYNQWLGTWELPFTYDEYETDEDGNLVLDEDENPVVKGTKEATYEITLSHADNNYIYIMTGWEVNGEGFAVNVAEFLGLTGDYANGYPIEVYFNNGKLEFVETDLDELNNQTTGETYVFGFYGIADILDKSTQQETEDGLSAWAGMTMANAMTSDGQTGTIMGESFENDSFSMLYTGMGYMAYASTYMYFNPAVMFPISMNKISDETLTALSLSKKSLLGSDDLRKAKAVKTMKANKPVMLTK